MEEVKDTNRKQILLIVGVALLIGGGLVFLITTFLDIFLYILLLIGLAIVAVMVIYAAVKIAIFFFSVFILLAGLGLFLGVVMWIFT